MNIHTRISPWFAKPCCSLRFMLLSLSAVSMVVSSCVMIPPGGGGGMPMGYIIYDKNELAKAHHDPAFRESIPPAVFPNTRIPPKYPPAVPQTHGLDLSKHDPQTALAYYQWLCANEAGEFIYKTVDNVEAVFEMRRLPQTVYDWRVYDRYYLESPWHEAKSNSLLDELILNSPDLYVMYSQSPDNREFPERNLPGKGYTQYFPEITIPVLERVSSEMIDQRRLRALNIIDYQLDQEIEHKRYGDGPYLRYTRVWPERPEYARGKDGRIVLFQQHQYTYPNPTKDARGWRSSPDLQKYQQSLRALGHIPPKVESVSSIKSRYGYMWRGIERSPHDRALGVAGGETLVFDLHSNEVLAVRRNFVLARPIKDDPRAVNWEIARACKDFGNERLHTKVLKPIDPYKNISVPERAPASVQPSAPNNVPNGVPSTMPSGVSGSAPAQH